MYINVVVYSSVTLITEAFNPNLGGGFRSTLCGGEEMVKLRPLSKNL